MDTDAAWQFAISDETPKGDESGDRFVVKDLKIFKAATFKDSRGRQRTWTPEELGQIVSNFETLRQGGHLVDVPVREDHSATIANVKGYFTAMRTDGKFLYADVEFTEPDGAEKYKRGTYRSRSIEVGAYETNGADPKTYWPVATGLAFVDTGAVEGLYRSHNKLENEVTTETVTFRIRGVETADHAAVRSYIEELEAKANKPATHTFRVNGSDETDFAKTQAHIDALETYRSESIERGRVAFVKSLEADRKIASTQVEGLVAFVKDLTPAQYDAWKAVQEGAPATFQTHAGTGNGNDRDERKLSEADACLETLRMHKMSGMDDKDIREVSSFQRYVQLTGNQPDLG
jgi:hypothetical protein